MDAPDTDLSVNELAKLLGSINESDAAPRSSSLPTRRSYIPSSAAPTGGAPSALRSTAAPSSGASSAAALLQKTLDRAKASDVRESREGRLPSSTSSALGADDGLRRFQTTVSVTTSTEIPRSAYGGERASSLPSVSESEPESSSDRSWMRSKTSTTTSATQPATAPAAFQDTVDFNVVRFNTEYSFRNKQGKYLQTVMEDLSDRDDASVVTFSSVAESVSSRLRNGAATVPQNTTIYLLGADGQGIGEVTDALQFVNLEQKDSTAPLMYGATVAIKSAAAKERLLGIKDGSRIGFWRHFVGEGEKWIVTKAVGAAPLTGCNGVTVPLTSLGVEDVSARHTRFVRVGDAILLQTKKSEHYLSVQDVFAAADPGGSGGSGGVEAIKLIYKERGGLLGAHEALVLEHFGTVPLPAWLTSRPYLSGQMLQVPAKFAQPSSDTEQRVFASSGASSAATTFLSTYRAEKERQQQQAQPDHASAVLSYAEMKKVKPLGQFTVAEQQAMLIRDLLCACMGLNGTYVRALPHSLALQRHTLLPPTVFSPANWGKVADLAFAFLVLPAKEDLSEAAIDVTAQGDRSLLNQVADVLPFCTMLLHLRDFVATQAQYDYGVVSHAFVRALRRLLQEFDVLVCQLEHLHNQRKLTLQKLLFFLQPSRRMMLVLHRVCCGSSAALGSGSSSGATDRGARDLIGGQLLQHLCQQLQAQGDAQAKQLVASLVAETAAPFLQMIAHWIYRGELHDPYHEFMIEEDVSVRKEALQADFNAQYWDHRYTLRPRHIPLALFSMDTAQRILMTGNHFHSLGKFFLLEHGDFFIQFMDMAETELRREVSDITLSRLRHLLSMAIQTSTVAQDAHRDALSCSLAPHNLIQHLNLIQMAGELSSATGATAASSSSSSSSSLAGGAKQQQQQFSSMLAQPTQGLKGIEALQLEYSVTWPASIVFSRRAVTKYQLLSRLLYFSKHVERRLLHAWQGQQYTRLLSALARRNTPQSRPLAMILRLSYTLRHRMLHFLQNLVYYMTLEVIHPRVTQLLSDVAQVTDMDRLLEIHEKFIDGCLRECLLASPELLKVLTKLMTTALLFADHMVSLMDTCHRVVSITPISATLLSGAAAAAAAAAAHNNGVITVSTSPLEKKRSFSQKHKDKDDGDSAAQSDANKEDAIALARHRQMQQQRRQRHAMQTETLQQEMSHEACHRVLTKFATTFDSQLKELLDGLWNNAYRQHAQLANLCVRLDYNGFYSSEFAT
eukprot:gene10690-7612_t